MQVQFIGCGDAFGSGGRFNTCFHVCGEHTNILIDCGASSLIAMKQSGIDRNAIDVILISHFHADHFGGIPFFVLDARFLSRRTRPLTIIGPRGLPDRYAGVMETAFAGSATSQQRFELSLREIEPGQPLELGKLVVRAFHVDHDDRAGPCLGYRIEAEGRTIAFSGDTQWTDALLELGRGADLFICEAYTRDKPVRSHMALALLEPHLADIRPKRLVLTHMSEQLLAQRKELPYQAAEDGMTIEI
jgi:ribonuclease BN (tRNA processing enzyme)